MTAIGNSVFEDNDAFCKGYLPNITTLTDVARSKYLKHPSTGIEDTLPNVVGQVVDEYMRERGSQDFANKLISLYKNEVPDREVMDEFTKTMARFNASANALHSVITFLRSNNYLEERLAKKLTGCNAERLRLENELKGSKEEIERLRSLVLLLHGDPDKHDDPTSTLERA